MDIQNYLNNFLTQILNGDSYLNKENRNVLKDAFGCYYGYGDPARIPFACYWVSLKMDTTFGAKLIANTWEQIKIDEPFSNNLRSDLIRNVKPYYKNNSVQLILERIEKTNMTKIDNQRVQELKDKYEFFKTQNQPEAWRKLILRSHVQLTEDLYIGKQIWIKNIGILKEVFDNIDIKVPIELAELEKDVKIKYWLAYSCCYLGNNKYPNKLDGLLVQRIDKLISDIEIERTNSKNVIKNETNYLYEEYQTFKQWHN